MTTMKRGASKRKAKAVDDERKDTTPAVGPAAPSNSQSAAAVELEEDEEEEVQEEGEDDTIVHRSHSTRNAISGGQQHDTHSEPRAPQLRVQPPVRSALAPHGALTPLLRVLHCCAQVILAV